MTEWQIQVERACPECDGRGNFPPKEEQSGRTRTWTSASDCSACDGGVQRKKIGLSELRELLHEGG
jgi:DnaJ-class molecular chaperone